MLTVRPWRYSHVAGHKLGIAAALATLAGCIPVPIPKDTEVEIAQPVPVPGWEADTVVGPYYHRGIVNELENALEEARYPRFKYP